jgi:hypothetical protein
MRNILPVVGITIFIILAGFGLYAKGVASYHCGLGNSILFGKNVVWAYYMGYCDK